jgi:2-C-methyl-D-erythritol 4-phosphate cytidylyltransferase
MSPSSVPNSPLDVGVLLPAAGRGERAGAGDIKQFRPIAGVPMLLRAVRPFANHVRVRQIVIALPQEHVARPPDWLADLVGQRLRTVGGGATRAASVRAALRALDPACTLVLVHDAARPFVSQAEIDEVIAATERTGGALAAIPISDTVKRAGRDRTVAETVPRDDLWRALTPQGFSRRVLEEAYARAGDDWEATDDAALVAAAGTPVVLVEGRTTNIKVTTPDDFLLAEALANR